MLFLYKTASESFRDQAVELLERHDIQVHIKTLLHHIGFVGRFEPGLSEYDIYVCNDDDFDLAKKLLIGIGADNPAPTPLPNVWLIIGFCLAATAAGLYFFDAGG
jgi:hypothetical protein